MVWESERAFCAMSDTQFESVQHWDSFYGELLSDGVIHYDWILKWSDLKAWVLMWLPRERAARLLHAGCGNSTLSADMVGEGWLCVVSVDYSHACLAVQRSHHSSPAFSWYATSRVLPRAWLCVMKVPL